MRDFDNTRQSSGIIVFSLRKPFPVGYGQCGVDNHKPSLVEYEQLTKGDGLRPTDEGADWLSDEVNFAVFPRTVLDTTKYCSFPHHTQKNLLKDNDATELKFG